MGGKGGGGRTRVQQPLIQEAAFLPPRETDEGKLKQPNLGHATPSIRILDTTLVTVFASRPNTDKIRDELATVSPSLEPLISHS